MCGHGIQAALKCLHNKLFMNLRVNTRDGHARSEGQNGEQQTERKTPGMPETSPLFIEKLGEQKQFLHGPLFRLLP
jgi:hypothetical protein